MTTENNIKKASKADTFPYDTLVEKTTNVLLGISRSGEICFPRYKAEYRLAIEKALGGEITLYATWNGQWSTDLFIIDNVKTLAAHDKQLAKQHGLNYLG